MSEESIFEGQAICPNCGGMDAGMNSEGDIMCYCCGFFTSEEIKKFKEA